MPTPNLLHIFTTGTHQPMEGSPLTFSERDLRDTIAAYDPSKHEAPIVVGHPKHDLPAYGWIKSLSLQNNQLFAEPQQLDPAFCELVNAGRYKKISAAFYMPNCPSNPVPGVFYLRHVGFLGAEPPAIKGLQTALFSDSDTDVLIFNQQKTAQAINLSHSQKETTMDKDEKSLLARLIEFLTKNLGDEEAKKVISPEQATAIEEAVTDIAPEAIKTDLPSDATADELLPEIASQLAVVSEENQRLIAENEELQSQISTEKTDSDEQTDAEFSELLRRKVRPSHRAAFKAAFHEAGKSKKGQRAEFSERGITKPLAPALRAFLKSLPDVVEFSEVAQKRKALTSITTNPLLADADRRAGRK